MVWNRLFPFFFWQGEDIVENESLQAAAKAATMSTADIEKCLNMIDSPEVKSSLKETTEDAIEKGVSIWSS